jgi:phage tail sheath protein FI
VAGFFINGGRRCYVAFADSQATDRAAALSKTVEALSPLDDLDLVAVPDAMTLRAPAAEGGAEKPDLLAITRVQKHVLKHCGEHGGRVAILDAVGGSSAASVVTQRYEVVSDMAEPLNGTLYFPWLLSEGGRMVPPCGHVAGIYARTDARVGVHKAPANERVYGVLDLETNVNDRVQSELNPNGVNCLRTFPGRGIRVWGARTLSRDPAWRYVSVRRIATTLNRWVERNLPWATFEPNEPRLWVRIRRELTVYLTTLWQSGALVGRTPEEAFYVRCDAETNPPEVRESGQTQVEIGLAPGAPAEFVVVRIIQRVGPPLTP